MRRSYVLMSLVLYALSYSALASTKDTWVGTTGTFSESTNPPWTNGGPAAWSSGGEIEFNTADTYVTVNDGPWDFLSTVQMSFEFWSDATVEIAAGADLSIRKLYLGTGGMGHIVQTGGSFAVPTDYCYIGDSGGEGSYTISGGSFTAGKLSISNAVGTFAVIGDAATISTGRLYVGSDRSGNYGTATLDFQITAAGVSPITTDEFHLDEGGASSTANLLLSAAAAPAADIVLIHNTDNSGIFGGTFDTLNGGSAAEGTQITLAGNLYELTYTYDADADSKYNDVALVFVGGGTAPSGAHSPNPEDDAIVDSTLALLDWINPDPNIPGTPVICTVYLGTSQDRLQMDQITLGDDVSDVSINTTNFPTYGELVSQARYYWAVDVSDPSEQTDPIAGQMWSFFVDNAVAPTADAGPDQIVWLGKSGTPDQEIVYLDGTTGDDGSYTVQWTQVDNGAPTVTISPGNVDDTSVTVTLRGTYEFMLTADDGPRQTSDTVQIIVGNDSCDASHMSTGAPYDAEDINQDCIVDLADFAMLFAEDWLVCTDTLTNCGN